MKIIYKKLRFKHVKLGNFEIPSPIVAVPSTSISLSVKKFQVSIMNLLFFPHN